MAALGAPALVAQSQTGPGARLLWATTDQIVQFVDPQSIAITDPCVIWIVDRRAGLQRFGCDGRYLGATGRPGAGPGEWRRLWSITAFGGDTAALFDSNLERLTLYRADGSYARSIALLVSDQSQGRIQSLTREGDSYLIWTDNYPAGEVRANESRSFVWRANPGATVNDSVLSFSGPESIIQRQNRLSSRTDAPFRRRPFVVLGDSTIVVGNNGSDSLHVYTHQGRQVAAFRVPLPLRRVTRADRRAFEDSTRASFAAEVEAQHYGPELRRIFADRVEALLPTIAYPVTWQRYDQLLSAGDGTFWLLLPGAGVSYTREWWRVDDCGRVVQKLVVPHRGAVRAAEFRGDRLFAIERNATDDTSRLAAYGLPR